MPKQDTFYTPSSLAAKMVSACSSRPRIICDFAVGGGELLSAALKRWPDARLVGLDISRPALAALATRLPKAEVGRCDFLSAKSRQHSPILRRWMGKVDLALLNPPFSCRGGERISVQIKDDVVPCSTAMAFVLHAMHSLSAEAEIVALLPAGCLDSEKDEKAWSLVRELAEVTVVSDHDRNTFGKCFPSTRIIHIKNGTSANGRVYPSGHSDCRDPYVSFRAVTLHRGTVQMHSIPSGRCPLVHSTDLQSGSVVPNGYKSRTGYSSVRGPFVAVSRVGTPNRGKVALWANDDELAISDCIIALQCADIDTAVELHARILENWNDLADLYSGTGAKYITTAKFARFIHRLGFVVNVQADAKWQLRRAIRGCS